MRKLHYLLFIVSITSFLSCLEQGAENGDSNPGDTPEETIEIDTTDWKSYQNADHGIAFRYPADWLITEQSQEAYVINVYPRGRGAESALPLGLHEEASLSYLSIFPEGMGTELPAGGAIELSTLNSGVPNLQFGVKKEESSLFRLENGTEWAYYLRPLSPPMSWSKYGFIFAQIGVNNFTATCYDEQSGAEKPTENCDPMAGDQLVRAGEVKEREAKIIHHLLSSIQIGQMESQTPIRELIRVEKPLPNLDIESPYTIQGKAVGYWYNEGSFPVRLYDADENLLAEAVAKAQGNWMTEDFVTFEATLEFDAPDDERGTMVFERANPSGLPENSRQYSIPVIFPPQ